MCLRIGLLQCDHVADELVEDHGDYQDMFSALLHAQDARIEVVVFDLINNQFPDDVTECDGYILTGSQFSAYDDIPWIHKTKALIRELYQCNIPTIGICFGHQLIAESLGGKVEKAVDKGWGVGVLSWTIKQPVTWMGDKRCQYFSMRASHQDQVVEAPKKSQIIAGSDFCPIAGFQLEETFLTFQGHPEFSKAYNEALIKKRVDRIGKEVAHAALDSLSKEVDGMTVGAWMVNFIKKGKQNVVQKALNVKC